MIFRDFLAGFSIERFGIEPGFICHPNKASWGVAVAAFMGVCLATTACSLQPVPASPSIQSTQLPILTPPGEETRQPMDTTELIERYGAGERDFSGLDLTKAELSGVNLSGADLSQANLSLARLNQADLSGANLSQANLSGAILQRANLSQANLTGADLSWADMGFANLMDANLTDANMQNTILIRARLKGATMPDGTKR
jgi:uncharacterized protein YjbI with pentapeptide repeats